MQSYDGARREAKVDGAAWSAGYTLASAGLPGPTLQRQSEREAQPV